MARIEPVGSVFHLGIRLSRVAQQHNVKIGLSNGDLYLRRDVRRWEEGYSKQRCAFCSYKADRDFSLFSYTLLHWDCIGLLVKYSIWSEKQIMEGFLQISLCGLVPGFRIRIVLMRIRIQIRIQHFFYLRIRIPDQDTDPGYDDLKLK